MIKVVFLLAYDYEYVKFSLPCVYEYADQILFSIDKNRISWSGNTFKFDESIIDWIKTYDVNNKIRFYEDDFYVSSNTPMQNDTRQRLLSANFLGKGGWTLMIDVDEYFLNFQAFVTLLNKYNNYLIDPKKTPICIAANWINVFKQDESGFYFISESNFPVKIATNNPEYTMARDLNHFTYYSDFVIVHQSWARPKEEMKFKLENWSHKNDVINASNYYEFWLGVNENNYKKVKDFCNAHPASAWKRLDFIKAKDPIELIKESRNFKPNRVFLFRKNLVQLLRKNKLFREIRDYFVELIRKRSYNG